MILRLILGRAGSGKSRLCLREINDRLKESPFSESLIYLIPKQASFQAEYGLATSAPQGGSIRAQALSFKRLAWKVMQETGKRGRLFLDDTGKSMIMLRILQEKKGKLRLFSHAGEQPGMPAHLVQFYNEMKRYCFAASSLKEILEQKKGEMPLLLQDKLADLSVIMGEMERSMEGRYLDGEDTLSILIEKMPDSEYLRGAEIWVDGFYSFTRLEYRVLEGLLQAGCRVTVTLCLDRDYPPEGELPANSFFYSSALALRKLVQMATDSQIPCKKIFLAGKGGTRFCDNATLGHLEQNLYRFPTRPSPAGPAEAKTPPLILASAANRRREVEAVARRIVHQVRDAPSRWRDMAILAGNLGDYRDQIITVFEDYEIPFFLDERRPAAFHPLVEFLCSSVEVVTRGWRYDGVFRCIRTGFLFPLPDRDNTEQAWRNRASRLENHVLALGIQGRRWLDTEPWVYFPGDRLEEDLHPSGEKEEARAGGPAINEIEETRLFFAAPLAAFQKEFKKAANAREKTVALFHLLENVSARKRLELWSREDLKKGDLEWSRIHAQVYNGIVDMLEQLAELMGETDLSAAQFSRVLETGMGSLSLSLVPPSLDRVLIGDLERTRLEETPYVYILGANDGVLPARLQEDGVLTGEERQGLEKAGFQVAPDMRVRLLDQQFHIYMAMTRALSTLWVSYPHADEDGRALMPSLLIAHLRDLFPGLGEEHLEAEPVGDSFREVLPFLIRPRQTLSLLAVQLGRWKKGGVINPFWWQVYNWYAHGGDLPGAGSRLMGGLFYRNEESPIDRDTGRMLYGQQWKTGISRLEMYRACPFSQFLAYGLKLNERKLYRLESMDIGRFFHMALRNVLLSFLEKEIDFSSTDEKACLLIVEDEVDRLVPRLQKEILLSSKRYLHLAYRLKKTVGLAVLQMVEHFRRGRFRPVGIEIPFGSGGDLPSPELDPGGDSRVEIVGRIDRIDQARDEEGRIYLRVIDYKSGEAKLVPAELFHGLSLQLLTYLDVALAASGKWLSGDALPAGIFYFRIRAPFINANKNPSPEQLAGELLKQYRMAGRCLDDPQVIRLMDSSLVKGHSPILPVGLKAGGDLYKNSSVFSLEQFEALRRRVRFMLQKTAGEIAGGQVGILPYQLGKKRACTFCPYKAICQFDPAMEENNYILYPNLNEKRIWELLQGGEEDEKGI